MKPVRLYILVLGISCMAACRAYSQEAMTWDDCVKEAARNNPGLISAIEAVKASEAAGKATASGQYPQIGGRVSGTLTKSTGSAASESYAASLDGSQLVYDGKKTVNNIKAAQENITASKQNFRYTSSDVRRSLRRSFVNLLKAQELTRIAEEIYEIRRGSLELITLRYQSGLEHRGALLTAESNLAQAQYAVNSARRDLTVARSDLCKEMGRPRSSNITVAGDFIVRDIPADDLDLEAIAARNPQVLRAVARKNSAEFDLRSAYADYAPSVSIEAGIGKTGTTFLPQSTQKSAGLTLSMPLLEGGLRHAQVAQARASVNQLGADETSVRNTAIAELEQYRAALFEAIDNASVQEKALRAAEERSRIAEAQYSIGAMAFDSWTIIEDNLVSAKRSYLNARAAALLAEAD
ncbi:MAG TPA: TolC family protein [Candidatus Omnitrophota bacterium]|nr:TolC family protein [Candidatus Omnitrophota bacterium]